MIRPSKKQSIVIAAVLLVAVATAWGIVQYRQGPSIYASAISRDVRESAGFTLYVPRQLPDGFMLDKDKGVDFSGGVLFLRFSKNDQTIFVAQQKKPNPEPSLSTISGFKPLDGVSAGKAIIGEQDGSAAAIVLGKDSLISIASDGTVSTGDLGLVAKRLEAIQ